MHRSQRLDALLTTICMPSAAPTIATTPLRHGDANSVWVAAHLVVANWRTLSL